LIRNPVKFWPWNSSLTRGLSRPSKIIFYLSWSNWRGFPREIRVKKIAAVQLLQPITDLLNIPVALHKDLPNSEEARWAMIEFLSRK
jgi:hypothetical protein